jgi:DNA-binding protein H-NS
MSQRGNEGKRIWRERGPVLAQEITDEITTKSTERMNTWVEQGRIPRWIRIKARLQGRPVELPR